VSCGKVGSGSLNPPMQRVRAFAINQEIMGSKYFGCDPILSVPLRLKSFFKADDNLELLVINKYAS